jgi:SAM-dependent methyltransferase
LIIETPERNRSDKSFDSAYGNSAPWDIGRPQPALIELLDEYKPLNPIIDAGSGSGYLTLWLAEKGFSVIGVDTSEAAVAQAQANQAQADPSLKQLAIFRVGDALHLTQIQESVKSVVDSGFFHLFSPDDRREFVQELAQKLPSGGRYYLLGFAFQSPMPNAPRQVTAEELKQLFSTEQGWKILSLRQVQFVTVRGNVPAIAGCFERA